MKKEVAILLMSHGNFASEAIKSAELIVGKQENYETFGVFLVDEVQALKEEMLQKVKTLDTSQGLLVFTDIIGGTPTNLASQLLVEENVLLCSGLNVPMLLVALLNRDKDITTLQTLLQDAYQEGFSMRTNKDLLKEEEDDDLL